MSRSRGTQATVDEDELRAVQRGDAERYEVPASGADKLGQAIREQDQPPHCEPLPSVSWARHASGAESARRVPLVLAGVAAAVVLALVIGSIGRSGGDDKAATRQAGVAGPAARDASGSGTTEKSSATTVMAAGRATTPSPGAPSSSAPEPRSPATGDAGSPEKIVKTGSFELQVPRRTFSDRVARLTTLTQGLGGYVAEASTSEQGVAPSGTIAFRVPANHFEDLLVATRRLGRVRSATTATQDVTSDRHHRPPQNDEGRAGVAQPGADRRQERARHPRRP